MVTVEQAAANLGELLERVHASRETAIIMKEGRALARITPLPAPAEASEDLVGFLRRWRLEHPDPDDQLAESIDLSREAVRLPYDPWA